MNLFRLLEAAAQRRPDAPAVYHGNDLNLTYEDLKDRALRLSNAVVDLGADGRVAIASHNCPQYLEILFGTWAAGLTVIPVNAKLHAKEILDILHSSKAGVVFCSESIADALQGLNSTELPPLIVIGSKDYQQIVDSNDIRSVCDLGGNEVAWIFYTSGTTGKPKGAMLTHQNLLSMAITFLADVEAVHHSHSILHAAPMSHGSGLYSIPYVLRGASHVIPKSGGFSPGEFLECAASTSYCAAFLAPTMVQRLLTHMTDVGVGAQNLKAIIYGGGPMHLPTVRRALELLGPILIQIYGQGEAPMTITVLDRDAHITELDDVLTSVGWPQAGIEVRIVDPQGDEQPANAAGEIVCRGMVVMKGYLDDPKETSAALRDGWLHTGDLGYTTEDGRLHLAGRVKELIISGGSNVYPREVEDVLLGSEVVDEVCVAGLEDREWGEKVVAFVVASNETAVSKASLDAICLDNLARFKRPKDYFIVPSLPKNSAGKVLRNELLRLVGEGLEPL